MGRPLGIVIEWGLYLIAGAAVAGAMMAVAIAMVGAHLGGAVKE